MTEKDTHARGTKKPEEEMDRFAGALETDASLQKEVEALGGNLEAIVKLANSKGYGFTLADLPTRELNDEELAAVAGGTLPGPLPSPLAPYNSLSQISAMLHANRLGVMSNLR